VNTILARWNVIPASEATDEVLSCCGSRMWAHTLVGLRPFSDCETLLAKSDEVWLELDPVDWDEAFSRHPRIGEGKTPTSGTAQSAAWSNQEQSAVILSGNDIQERLRHANGEYEKRFGRIYIVSATGKSAEQMLAILEHRLNNDEAEELHAAAEQQRQITQLRLRKWLEL
jgi:2-oxo-4-hydroxy-4-carboxy-5-ureidoimidazoline decarboxylase